MLRLLNSSRNLLETLSDLRTRALRRGIWFQVLTTEDRILTGLLRKHIKIVKNAALATVVARIIGKLLCGLKNSFWRMIEGLGQPIAESWARAAYSMGWKGASKWVQDVNIVRWYGLMAYNSSMNIRGTGKI